MASETPDKPTAEEKYSTSELLASAKVVSEASQAALRNESDKVDKAKAADAAGDLLDAASQYAKLDEQKGVGQYVDKAADYLHDYKPGGAAPAPAPSKPEESQGEHAAQSAGGGGLGGDFTKLAGGFFKK
ncbi:nodulin-related protein 2-like [Lotus japonicus]|uniref:nodulin-related protein 2-like n=1 Tax=Lotus japonicus TaxID=34305 RepID=UPI002586CD96|nr:nodulin-related protein 2-like [Lotus japonicus]